MTPRPGFFTLALLALAFPALAFAQQPASSSTSDPSGGGTDEEPEPEVSTAAAPAEEAPPPPPAHQEGAWDRILAGSATLGLDTPVGIFGATVEVSPVRYFTVYGGGGIGRSGARMAFGLRGQYPVGFGAVGAQVGIAAGPLDWDSLGPAQPGAMTSDASQVHRGWDFALYLDWAITAEWRFTDGLFGRLMLGVESTLTTPDVCRYVSTGESCAGSNLVLPTRGWAGLSIGYALGL